MGFCKIIQAQSAKCVMLKCVTSLISSSHLIGSWKYIGGENVFSTNMWWAYLIVKAMATVARERELNSLDGWNV